MSNLSVGWILAIEGAKLIAQLGGALLVAWLAVRWALRRYKQEKHWERRLAAYVDVVSAMTTAMEVLGRWEESAIRRETIGDEIREELKKRYMSSLKTITEANGLASLLLPESAAKELLELLQRLSHIRDENAGDFIDVVQLEWTAIDEARTKIVAMGRKDLGLS